MHRPALEVVLTCKAHISVLSNALLVLINMLYVKIGICIYLSLVSLNVIRDWLLVYNYNLYFLPLPCVLKVISGSDLSFIICNSM
jgi:hypothetical protein